MCRAGNVEVAEPARTDWRRARKRSPVPSSVGIGRPAVTEEDQPAGRQAGTQRLSCPARANGYPTERAEGGPREDPATELWQGAREFDSGGEQRGAHITHRPSRSLPRRKYLGHRPRRTKQMNRKGAQREDSQSLLVFRFRSFRFPLSGKMVPL